MRVKNIIFREVYIIITSIMLLQGCFIIDLFKKNSSENEATSSSTAAIVIGQSLGAKSSGINQEALNEVYNVKSTHSPALIRPDPDLIVRNLLSEYHEYDVVLAQQIGKIEPYRELLGGASEDFSKPAQNKYDATSLLTVYKISENVCISLVAPVAWAHKDWHTIMPYDASKVDENIRWLVQRFLGIKLSDVSSAKISLLKDIMTNEEPFLEDEWWGHSEYSKYVPVCATLSLDSQALLF